MESIEALKPLFDVYGIDVAKLALFGAAVFMVIEGLKAIVPEFFTWSWTKRIVAAILSILVALSVYPGNIVSIMAFTFGCWLVAAGALPRLINKMSDGNYTTTKQ